MVEVYELESAENGLIIRWVGEQGFGEYTIFYNGEHQLCGDSEYMDRGEDKEFLKQLFESMIEIVG